MVLKMNNDSQAEVVKVFSLKLRANSVESGPPLSTILGNYFVNTTKFCKEFNEFTVDLPKYFLLEVKIWLFRDKTFKFIIMKPTITFLLRIFSFNKEIKVKFSGNLKIKIIKVVKLTDIYLISKFKYGLVSKSTLNILSGILYSMDLYVIK